MTTSQTAKFFSAVIKGERIPEGKLAYFRARLRTRLHDLVLSEFARLALSDQITRAELAERIGRQPEQITRWLGSPGNWTLDTLSDLALGMGAEPTVSLVKLTEMGKVEQFSSESTDSKIVEMKFLEIRKSVAGNVDVWNNQRPGTIRFAHG
jgi:hypothetical protein